MNSKGFVGGGKWVLPVLVVGICVFSLAGCGGGGGGGSKGGVGCGFQSNVLLLFSSSDPVAKEAVLESLNASLAASSVAPVAVEDIESLILTVTEIVLDNGGNGSDDFDDDMHTVVVRDFEFDPTSLTIERGETVRWVWETDTFHTVTSGDLSKDELGTLFNGSGSGVGHSFEVVFDALGVFPYVSNTPEAIDAGMAGTIIVTDDDGDDDDDDDKSGERFVLFSGSIDVDFFGIEDSAYLLSRMNIPADRYTRIELSVENPRLVLKADPDTVITNVHLTANGRLFLEQTIDLRGFCSAIIDVDFGGVHLVETGNDDKYVLTPQLTAEVSIQSFQVLARGTIVSFDPFGDGFTVVFGGSPIQVVPSDDVLILDASGNIVTLDDLHLNQPIEVWGVLTNNGVISAEVILFLD